MPHAEQLQEADELAWFARESFAQHRITMRYAATVASGIDMDGDKVIKPDSSVSCSFHLT